MCLSIWKHSNYQDLEAATNEFVVPISLGIWTSSHSLLTRCVFRKPDDGPPEKKRLKVEEEDEDSPDDDDDDDDDDVKGGGDDEKKSSSAVDITEKFIFERINPILAAELVIFFIPEIDEVS